MPPYEEKRDAYLASSANLLARSLHPLAYENNPAFVNFIQRTDLDFRHMTHFEPQQQQERQELMIRLAEWVWNPARLNLHEVSPPIHQPISDLDNEDDANDHSSDNQGGRFDARLAFWTHLLEYAHQYSDLHRRISPNKYHWLGTRRHGVWWNYYVTQSETRIGIYLDAQQPAANKALFDALFTNQTSIEKIFGEPLNWQRMNEKKGSQITFSVDGGWLNDSEWPKIHKNIVGKMGKLYRTFTPVLEIVRKGDEVVK